MILRTDIRRRMVRINMEIPDEVHARLKMLASAEGLGFYEWVKELLVGACPDEQTLIEILRDIRRP
jgi:predicted DNA binding CopG/RHH family protein